MFTKTSTLALVVLVVIGFVLGGRDPGMRSVMGLGTRQRNVATALLVSGQNFAGTNTLTFVLVSAIVLLLILMPTARQLGARVQMPSAGGEEMKIGESTQQ